MASDKWNNDLEWHSCINDLRDVAVKNTVGMPVSWKEYIFPILCKIPSGFYLEGLRQTMKNLSG
jgi:hypothetical protein